MKFDQVQKGDKVFCLVNGHGEVTELQVDVDGRLFQFIVLFKGISSSFELRYDLSGKTSHYFSPTLYWQQPNPRYITDIAPRREYSRTYYAAINLAEQIIMFPSTANRKEWLSEHRTGVIIEEPITVKYTK